MCFFGYNGFFNNVLGLYFNVIKIIIKVFVTTNSWIISNEMHFVEYEPPKGRVFLAYILMRVYTDSRQRDKLNKKQKNRLRKRSLK